MIGRDDNEEEVTYKVADRRKFNPDGSLREGVTIEPEPVKPPEPPPAEARPAAHVAAPSMETSAPAGDGNAAADGAEGSEEDIPGIDDPASFVNFLSTLATNTAAALGAVPHPATGQRSLDLDTGKYWLDVIAMLKEKTKGNLHPQESKMLDSFLGEMRMHYVQLVRATEEKLKAQAAQKFSGGDILGKK
jgi:hypothetical protein